MDGDGWSSTTMVVGGVANAVEVVGDVEDDDNSFPETELVLYPLQDKLTSRDKSLDLSAFKLSRLFFSLLSSGSLSCWRSYGAQLRLSISLSDYSLSDLELFKDIYT
ncbi:hypothetical protein Tco_1315795 [Tanacetum coccineum]